MVSTRRGTKVEAGHENAVARPKVSRSSKKRNQDALADAPTSKKAKVNSSSASQDDLVAPKPILPPNAKNVKKQDTRPATKSGADEKSKAAEENKENAPRASTPPAKSEAAAKHVPSQTTPGRDGPIRPRRDNVPSPDIKPFKGPPGQKVRKTAWEKEEEYKQHIRDTPAHVFHDLYVCYDKGRDGSPTYDEQGFQLDYEKVCEWMAPKPYNKARMVNGMARSLERDRKEREEMVKIFFKKGAAPGDWEHGRGVDHWKDRVSKDLGVPWHRVGVEEFREWEKRAFKKAEKGEYQHFSAKEVSRMNDMHLGSALRK